MNVEEILGPEGLVATERERQEQKGRDGLFAWTCSSPHASDADRLAVLVEEVGEVARAVLGNSGAVTDGGDLEKELVQVAAVATAWLESM